MKDVKDSMTVSGYSREEVYFYEQNKKLIEELRKKRSKLFELGKKFEGNESLAMTQAPRPSA